MLNSYEIICTGTSITSLFYHMAKFHLKKYTHYFRMHDNRTVLRESKETQRGISHFVVSRQLNIRHRISAAEWTYFTWPARANNEDKLTSVGSWKSLCSFTQKWFTIASSSGRCCSGLVSSMCDIHTSITQVKDQQMWDLFLMPDCEIQFN